MYENNPIPADIKDALLLEIEGDDTFFAEDPAPDGSGGLEYKNFAKTTDAFNTLYSDSQQSSGFVFSWNDYPIWRNHYKDYEGNGVDEKDLLGGKTTLYKNSYGNMQVKKYDIFYRYDRRNLSDDDTDYTIVGDLAYKDSSGEPLVDPGKYPPATDPDPTDSIDPTKPENVYNNAANEDIVIIYTLPKEYDQSNNH
jgi:hypothetical protein